MMFYHKTKKWYDRLQKACDIMNARIIPGLGLAPADIDYDNDNEVYRILKRRIEGKVAKSRGKPYAKGDFVRLRLYEKDLKYKGYKIKWTDEIYRISEVTTWKRPIKYRLEDLNGAPVDIYSYYKAELLKIDPNVVDDDDHGNKRGGRGRRGR